MVATGIARQPRSRLVRMEFLADKLRPLNAVAVMLIPWIVNVYVVDPQSPVGLENDTPSARPAGAANGNCKNDELLT